MEAAVIDRMLSFQDNISKRNIEQNNSKDSNFESVMKEASKSFEKKDGEKVQRSQKDTDDKGKDKIKIKGKRKDEDSITKKEKVNNKDEKIEEENIEKISKEMVVGESNLQKTDENNLMDSSSSNEGLEKEGSSLTNQDVINISEFKATGEKITDDYANKDVDEEGKEEGKVSLTDRFYHHYYKEKDEEEVEKVTVVETKGVEKNPEDEIKGLESEENVFEVGPQMVETENMTLNYETGSQNGGKQENSEDNSKIEVVNLKKNKNSLKNDVDLKESFSYTDVKAEVKSKFDDIKNQVVTENQNVENPEDVIEQITEKAKAFIMDDKSEVVIKLKPDHLGKVSLKISVENGNISAKFLAESEKVREMLESNFNNLKDSLSKQGLNVQNLSVSVGNSNKERSFEQETSILARRINARKVASLGINNENEIYEDVETSGLLKNNYYWPNSTVSFSA